MTHSCKWCEAILAIIIFVFTVWPAWLGAQTSMWIVAIAAVVLFIHSFACKNCMMCEDHRMAAKRRR